MKTERTLLVIKPDGVKRCLVRQIVSRIEHKGLSISDMRMLRMDKPMATTFYAEHAGRDYFAELITFMTSGPIVALEITAPNAVSLLRATIGATRPEDRLPGTIRADFSIGLTENVVHASASPADAERELDLIFGTAHGISVERLPQQR